MLKLPNLNSLITFINAAHTGNFAKTAKALCITPAAVSQQIKQLESHLDTTLFERSKLGVEQRVSNSYTLPTKRLKACNVDKPA